MAKANGSNKLDMKKARKAHEEAMQEIQGSILTQSKIKEYYKSIGVRVSGDFGSFLARRVFEEMFRAVRRMNDNNRTTVQPRDL
jgi:hypothetical protein